MSWQVRENYARLRSGERPGARREFGRAQSRVALVYPNSYSVGMSNLGFHTVYRIINSSKGLLCDRFFPLEWSSSAPPLSFECERPLSDFDVLAFSVAFENDYLNVLRTLDMARVPFRSADRNASHPLVVLGGAVTFMNPEPMADFADVIVMGEAEKSSVGLFGLLARSRGASRREQLEAAAGIEGVYVPSLSNDGPPAISWGRGRLIREEDIAHSAIVAKEAEFSDTFLVEISRGCPYRCRFCAVGHAYPRFRSASADDLLELIDRRVRSGGLRPPVHRVGLVSSAVGTHPELDYLCTALRSMEIDIGVSSLRVDCLSNLMLRCLADSGTRTITIAPDAGSDRLRLVAGKDITEEMVIDGAARAVAHGILNLRLYFIVGLPTETDDDIDALMDLVINVRKTMIRGVASSESGGKVAGNLTVSLAPFVPKPTTPLQWSPMAKLRTTKRKIAMIRRGLGSIRGIRVTYDTLKSAYLQGILSRGGRDSSAFLEAAYGAAGDWKTAASKVGLDLDSALGERDPDEPLPWGSMLGRRKMEELRRECRRALSWVKK